MSQNFTYTELLKLVPQYMERSDALFLSAIPTFLALAENRLATDMKQQGYQAVVTGTFGSTNVLAKPSFWRETISFGYLVDAVFTPVHLRSLEYLRQFWPSAGMRGLPRYYADYNINNFYVAPTPAAGYDFELVYFARLEPLTEENQSNWNTLNAPQALLAAVLAEAAKWCGNQLKEARWKEDYATALAGLMSENSERLADRSTVVAR